MNCVGFINLLPGTIGTSTIKLDLEAGYPG